MNVGSRKQLFIDDAFLAETEGVGLTMNPPVQHPDPVLVPDRPWEAKGIAGYNTVIREASGDFRMWYGAVMKNGLPQEGAIRLAYAESGDGIHWAKPSLGLVPFQGSKDNNIVAPLLERQSQQGATVYRDERAPAEERYKLWTKFRPTDEQVAAGVGAGLWAMHSPDGIHWEEYPDQPNPRRQMCDTQNVFFWDDRIEQYVGYTRVYETQHVGEAAEAAGKGSYRSVGRITSPDFRTWSTTEIVFEADAEDLGAPVPYQRDDPRPNIDFYTNCAMKCPGAQDAYVMLPSAFYHWGEDSYPATMDVQLLASRDGIVWRRAGNREPFLRKGIDGSASGGMVFANPWLTQVGDEWWLYYAGTGRDHSKGWGDRPYSSAVFRSTMRRDGFVSLDAGFAAGEFTTHPLEFTGDRLELNVDAGAGGWVRVELQDQAGRPLAGYGMADCDAVVGNATRKTVTWRGKPCLDGVEGPVRMHVVMRAAKLYAFQFRRVVNEALRAGLHVVEKPAQARPYHTQPRKLGLKAGRNLDNIQELIAQVEGEEHR